MLIGRLGRAIGVLAIESLAITREALVLPFRAWMRAAEAAGEIVLAVWRALAPRLLLVFLAARGAVRIAERSVTPGRTLLVVSLCAAGLLAASQFADYRGVEIGSGNYARVSEVASAPQVDERTPIDEHGIALLAVAVGAVAATLLGALGHWRMPRNLLVLGVAVIAVSVFVDAPAGLDEGRAAIAYESAHASLEGGFWAQVAAGAVLAACGPLLAVALGREARLRGDEPRPRRSFRRPAPAQGART